MKYSKNKVLIIDQLFRDVLSCRSGVTQQVFEPGVRVGLTYSNIVNTWLYINYQLDALTIIYS